MTGRGALAAVVLAIENYPRLRALERQALPTFADHLLAMPQDYGGFDQLEIDPRGQHR